VRLTPGHRHDSALTGTNFRVIVDDPVMRYGMVVNPRGASAVLQAVKVAQSGRMKRP
jgi:hypothetical protein